MSVEIEFRIPIPQRNKGQFPDLLRQLNPGDSFSTPVARRRSLLVAASVYKAKHPGWSYTTRTEDGVTRLWRTT